MNNQPHGCLPVPRLLPGNPPEVYTDDSYDLAVPNSETDSTLNQQSGNTLFTPGLLPCTSNTRSAHSGHWPANADGGCGTHGISTHGSGILDGSFGGPDPGLGWDLVTLDPGSILMAPNNIGPIVDCPSGIPWHVNPGMLDEGPGLSNLGHPLGISGNVETGLDLGTPFDSGLNFTAFHENQQWPDCSQSDFQGVNALPCPTLDSMNANSFWNVCEAPSTGELHLATGSSHVPGVVHGTGYGSIGVENVLTLPMHPDQFAIFSSPHCFARDVACAFVPGTHSEAITTSQFGTVGNSDAALVSNTSFVTPGRSVENGDDGSPRHHQVVQKRNRHSARKWKDMEPHLRRVYCGQGHTAEEVAFEMSVIHGFEASVDTYKKRLASLGKKTRLRTAKALPDDPDPEAKTEIPQFFEIVSEQVRRTRAEEQRMERSGRNEERNRRRQLQVERGNKQGRKKGKEPEGPRIINPGAIGPFLETIYMHQEKLFHAIDAFCKSLFAAGNKSWTADGRRFKPPPQTPDSSRAWQLLSDQVAGVQMLVQGQLYHHANFLLRQVLGGLRVAARAHDPSFLVHFWTMCNAFSSVPVRTKGKGQELPWLGWFLRHLKQILTSVFGRQPLTDIVDSLLHVWASSPRDLKATLGLGHWKAIHTLGGLIGDTNNIVLTMGVCCTNTWKSKFSTAGTTVKLLRQPLLAAVESSLEPEHLAEVSLDYLSAVTRDRDNEPEVIFEACRLLRWTTNVCREKAHRQALQYDSVARAFVVATELVAKHHLETRKPPGQHQDSQPDRELSYQYMGEAIETLRRGDLQCRIRAASFSKRLLTWIKGHRHKKGERSAREAIEAEKARVAKEKARTREIVCDITKERIKGSRRGKWVRKAKIQRAEKEGRPLEKNLLLASLKA